MLFRPFTDSHKSDVGKRKKISEKYRYVGRCATGDETRYVCASSYTCPECKVTPSDVVYPGSLQDMGFRCLGHSPSRPEEQDQSGVSSTRKVLLFYTKAMCLPI